MRYARVAEDYRGLADVGAEEAKAAELGRSRAVRKALDDAKSRDEADRAAIRAIARKLNAALASPEPAASARRRGAARHPGAAPQGRVGLARRAPLGRAHPRQPARRRAPSTCPRSCSRRRTTRTPACRSKSRRRSTPTTRSCTTTSPAPSARAGQVGRTLADLQDAVDKGFRRFARIDGRPGLFRGARRPEVPRVAREGARRRRRAYAFCALRIRSRSPAIRARITPTRSSARGTIEIAFSTWASRRGVCRSWRSCGT